MSGIDKNYLENDPIEQALASLSAVAPRVDRDALMYQAGFQAALASATSSVRPARFWQAATGLMAAAAVTFAFMLARGASESSPAVAVGAAPESSLSDKNSPIASQVADANDESNFTMVNESVADEQLELSAPLQLGDPASNYLALRQAVLIWGVDSWPRDYRQPTISSADQSDPASQPAVSVRHLLNEMLPEKPAPSPANPDPSEASNHPSKSIA